MTMAFRAAGPAKSRHAKAKGLAKREHAGRAMAELIRAAKSVDAAPEFGTGGYSPVTSRL